jgi:hypothetical protein
VGFCSSEQTCGSCSMFAEIKRIENYIDSVFFIPAKQIRLSIKILVTEMTFFGTRLAKCDEEE